MYGVEGPQGAPFFGVIGITERGVSRQGLAPSSICQGCQWKLRWLPAIWSP